MLLQPNHNNSQVLRSFDTNTFNFEKKKDNRNCKASYLVLKENIGTFDRAKEK